jgi:uncharacterized protein (DUF697 family)
MAVIGLIRDAKDILKDPKPIVVDGALADQLGRELGRGAAPGAVRVNGRLEDAEALVYVLAGPATEADVEKLRRAYRSKVPIVAVQTSGDGDLDVPYVLATDVVVCPPGAGFPVEQIAEVVAARLGDRGAGVAARVPFLREAVCRELIRSYARKNGILGAAVFVPGADLPVLTLNQIRLVLRLAAAYGVEVDQQRLPEILAVLGVGFGARALARQVLGAVPVAGWAVKGAVAYAATRAVGEAAARYFASVAAAR